MQETNKIKSAIKNGETYLGIELGSTRIKAVLIDNSHQPVASGSHTWENRLVDNIWTYSMEDAWNGLRACYSNLAENVKKLYGCSISTIGAIGFSGMMHGYLAFDSNGNLLTPFRTWRNTITGKASEELTDIFRFNIPQRWSIAHLYQAILNDENHVPKIAYITTLAGYIHWQLTGQKAVGVGEASGMFPIDGNTGQFDSRMINIFDNHISARNFAWKLGDILPKVLAAGENAGSLTEEGAARLDPGNTLGRGIPFCPPEGDAGTGMVATNCVAKRTGNISAGTSIFAMIVLEKELSKVYPEIDMVTTPSGKSVAMVHCNNCTSDIDAWIELFGEFSDAIGAKPGKDDLYALLYGKALEGDPDCGGLLSYNYFSGEPVTGFSEGRPLFLRPPDSRLTLANFMRAHLFSALGSLKIGMDILFKGEDVRVDSITGHGGFFKVKGVGQKIMASALGTPVTVMNTAGEGGPWGMSILASYMKNKRQGETLEDFLSDKVFSNDAGITVDPDPETVSGFKTFMLKYKKALAVERAAIESI